MKRTKLGLREFVKLGDFVQTIEGAQALAVNKVDFSVSGLGLLRGSLTIKAGFRKAGPQRVDIDFHEASLVSSIGCRVSKWMARGVADGRPTERGRSRCFFLLITVPPLRPSFSPSPPLLFPQVPQELQRLFEANYDMLLSIFNPQGHLDVTYLDSTHRVGRDDKGNIFYLERCP